MFISIVKHPTLTDTDNYFWFFAIILKRSESRKGICILTYIIALDYHDWSLKTKMSGCGLYQSNSSLKKLVPFYLYLGGTN